MDKKIVQRSLNDIILNLNENSNIRQKALETFMNLVMLGKIRKRVALNLLLDEWIESEDAFLEISRLKSLFLFYEDESEEIEEVYKSLIDHDDLEVKSECLFQLGLMNLLNANVMINKEEYTSFLEKSLFYFENSNDLLENRMDAKFFSLIVSSLIETIHGSHGSMDHTLKIISKLLWEQRVFSFDEEITSLQVGLYRSLSSFRKISLVNINDWLDFRKGFNDLCYYFYEIKNQEFKNVILRGVSDNLIRRSIEPLFSIQFNAEICRIDQRLNEIDEDTQEHKFLLYLKKVASESNQNELAERELILNELIKTFPNIEKSRIVIELSKIKDVNNTISIFKLYNLFSSYSYDNLLNSVVSSCISLQGNKIFWNATENERNTFIAHSLNTAGFISKDQSLWGTSRGGKTSGEVDIFIKEKNGDPFSIIEALNLESLDRNYLNLHLEKIFSYDTTGLKYNFIIVYSSSKNFSEFWNRYINYTSQFEYPHPVSNCEELEEFDYTDIRICKTSHTRNDKETYLYHIVVDLNK